MSIEFFNKGMEPSEFLNDTISQKLEKTVCKFFNTPVSIHVTYHVENHDHMINLKVFVNKQVDFTIQAATTNMYQTAEKVIEKLNAKLHKLKEIRASKDHRSIRALSPEEDVVGEDDTRGYISAEDIIKYEQAKRHQDERPGANEA